MTPFYLPATIEAAMSTRLLLLPLLLTFCFASSSGADEQKPASMRIGPYDFQLPTWWDSVRVEVPETLKTSQDVWEHVVKTLGSDKGTEKNWREALKAHALGEQRIKGFPVFIAHCFMTGKEYRRAAEVYADLYELADTQPEHKDWYRCYLAYETGLAYDLLDDAEKARMWSLRAATYVNHKDKAIAFYAGQAQERAKRNQPIDPAMTSDDPDYGFTEKKPTKVGSKEEFAGPAAERAYLNELRDEKGKLISYKRVGSVGKSAEGNPLDLYEVTTSTGKQVKLYLDMYHPQNAPAKQLAPKGFTKQKS
jgi:hypothetical protein